MRASDLIAEVQAQVDRHGDAEIGVLADGQEVGDVLGVKLRCAGNTKPVCFEISTNAPGCPPQMCAGCPAR